MFAKDIMTPNLELIGRNAMLVDAARKMAERNIGLLPVVDRNHVVGMLTDRDLVVRAMARSVDPTTTEVDLVMTPEVITCSEDSTIELVAQLMERHGLRRILVVDDAGMPSGVISIEDLAARSTDKHLAATALYRGTGRASLEPSKIH